MSYSRSQNSLKYAFLKFINEQKLLSKGERVCIAVSGGVDSMVLLNLMILWTPYFKIELSVLHFNHQLRGEASDEDARFVENVCSEAGIPCYAGAGDVHALAKAGKLSIEEAARALREEFIGSVIQKHAIDKIATGHNLNDQAETVLMRMIGGSGIEGLAGIRIQRGAYIRPLLFASREEIQQYAIYRQIACREDESNQDIRFVRNRIRHRLLPVLRAEFNLVDLQPFLNRGIVLQEWLQEAEKSVQGVLDTHLQTLGQNKIRLDMAGYEDYFSGIQLRVVEAILEKLLLRKTSLSFNQFRDFHKWVQQKSGKRKFGLQTDVIVSHRKGHLVFERIISQSSPRNLPQS